MKHIKYFKDIDPFNEEWDEDITIIDLNLIKKLKKSKYLTYIRNQFFNIPNTSDNINYYSKDLPYMLICSINNCIKIFPFNNGENYLLITENKHIKKEFNKNEIFKIKNYIRKKLQFNFFNFFLNGTHNSGPK